MLIRLPQQDRRPWSHVRALEATGDPADAARAWHVRSRNPTPVKQSRRDAADHEAIVNQTNRTVREIYSAHPAMMTLVSEDLSRMRADAGKGKRPDRRVSRWQCAALDDALERSATAHGSGLH